MSFEEEPQQAVQRAVGPHGRRAQLAFRTGANPQEESHHSPVDAAGARALADRIAVGKPAKEGSVVSESPWGRDVLEPQPSPAVPASAVQIVRLNPERATRREVRIYVRGPNGELERRS